jgi:Reverse transcriptase (RNA-dependent DNA polymerase)
LTKLRSLILTTVLSKGYFPQELPPVFTTTDFGAHADDILKEWESAGAFSVKAAKNFSKIGGKLFVGKYSYKSVPSAEPEVISKPKRNYERRNVHITHPIPQALLVREMADNWKKIQKWLLRQQYSEDKIIISPSHARGIQGINFKTHHAKKSYLEATSDWLIRTDISRFYPSIYTHSIPWAAYGKERVKANLKTYEGTLADRLDLLVRSCNRNQTIGIPIGPETSRVIAEIVSARIDSDFSVCVGKRPNHTIDRLQDDWTVGAKSLHDAENLLSIIAKCYRDYGLEINGSKTSVSHILASKQDDWRSEISGFLSHRRGGLAGSRLEDFLSLCIRLQLDNPSAPVLSYALSVLEGRNYRSTDMEKLESFLLKAAVISPISMDRICRIILNIEHQTGGLSKDRLANRFVELAERNFENGCHYEVIWLLYTMRGLKKAFHSKRIMDLAEGVQSSVIRLLLLDMNSLGLLFKSLPTTLWASDISAERSLTDWSWLVSYEAIRKGWLPDPGTVMQSPFFKAMNSRNVVFYDKKRNVKASAVVKRLSRVVRKRQTLEMGRIISSFRGLTIGDFEDYDYDA